MKVRHSGNNLIIDQIHEPGGVLSRITLGWAAGIVVTALFWPTLRNQQKSGSP